MGKINPNVSQLQRTIFNNFKEESSNPHPELKRKKRTKSKSVVPTNRRDKRRLAKKLKKARRIAYSTKASLSDLYAEILQPKKRRDKKNKVTEDELEKSKSEEDVEKIKKNINNLEERRIQEVRQRLKEDEREIKLYAKKLKLNKRKSKSLPKSFVDDGLGYLLELCNPENRQKITKDETSEDDEGAINIEDDEQPMSDTQSEPDDTEMIDTSREGSKNLSKKRVRFAEEVQDEEETDAEELEAVESDTELVEDEIASCSASNEDDEENVDDEDDDDDDELREDIYGRLRDKQGNVVQTHQTDKASKESETSSAKRETLKKLFRSLINRLGEATVQSAVSKVQEAYKTHSRNDVKEILTETIFQSCVRPERIPDRLILEQCLFLALIHNKISTEITSYFVERLALELKRLRESTLPTGTTDNKTLDNMAVLFSHLFSLKIVHHKLVFDVIQYCVNTFEEKDIELILLILQSVGFTLRKENPIELKSIIDKIHFKSASVNIQTFSNQSRVKFMLDTLQSIKNNNTLKVGNYDPELVEHFVKVLRGLMSGKPLESPLPMSLNDLWQASEKGRWWIVGSAVIVPDAQQIAVAKDEQRNKVVDLQFSDELLALAKKNRMNTELRRNIFCVLMSSEDYLDAFEKLMKLSLKNQQEREIVHISLACCLKEKSFNPFYVYLVERFCTNQPRFILTSQFAIWDKLKVLDELSLNEVKNLASFVSHLIANEILNLTVLKVLDFGRMEDNCLQFLTVLFTKFLTNVNDDSLKKIFMDCIKQKKSRSFLEGLKLFLQHAFPKRLSDKQRVGLSKKMNIVDQLLYYSADSFM